MNRTVNLTKRVQTSRGLRYCPVVLAANGRVRADLVIINGQEELVTFGLDAYLIDHQLRTLSKTPPGFLLRFPAVEIDDDVLRSLGFTAAAFQAA